MILLPPDRFRAVSRKNLHTAALSSFQNGGRQRAVVNRCFVWPEHRRFHFFAQRRLQLACVFGAKRLRLQSQPVVQCDNSAEFRLGIVREQRLERSFRPETRALSGNLFDLGDKLRIKREARFSQRHHRNHSRTLRRRRKNARAGPGRFLPQLLAVKHRHSQAGARQLQRDGSANHSTAGDGGIELLHDVILAHLAKRHGPQPHVRLREPQSRRRNVGFERTTRGNWRVPRRAPALFSPSCVRGSSP